MTSDQILNLVTIAALFVMTMGMGLELKFSEIRDVARDRPLIVKALIANFVLQPAAAVALLSGKAVLEGSARTPMSRSDARAR